MKTLNRYIFTFLTATAVLGFQGCEKALELDPLGGIEKEEVFNSEANIKSLLNSVYTVIGSDKWSNGRIPQFNDLLGDEFFGAQLGSTKGEIYNRNTSVFNDDIKGLHKEPYYAIQRANQVLDNIGIVSAGFKDNAEGQAKFARALGHFDLVKLFAQPYNTNTDNAHAGIILQLTVSVESAVARATIKQVYDQIILDLKDAEAKLPSQNGIYPTKWAAKALLARVYFQMNKFTEAYTYANDVLTNGLSVRGQSYAQIDYTKLAYADRFSVAGSKESIFEVVNEAGLSGRSNSYRDLYKSEGSNPEMKLMNSIYTANATDVNDKRGAAWYAAGTSADWKMLKKFDVQNFTTTLIHFTEMKLIRAESAAETGLNLPVGIADLNDIKSRAYGDAAALLPANASASLLKDQVRIQREKEMIGEGDRAQQIKRIGAKGETSFSRGVVWNCNGMILQFPGTEFNLNPLFVKNPEGGCN
ncbi:SusD family protein [Pedobacter steynii]|uniref:SusD family protein n=1 Tax=Pedobacter steynii TaxID=430522 RepID=A0A1H0H8M9_9SPHI|nr:RagB/SusD family nutrient uptake outer membrane protein [Pedobacter steynii]NQX42691.1 RagB/SusD family nutrient uptake outer membrane protein [Pedobacter steynii]SDO15566.1 SusD family protein [Pedobacter steynii]